jgi:hypothetical protein
MGETMAVPSPASAAQIGARRFAKPDRLFYVIAATLMLISTAEGFRNFYLHGRAPWGNVTGQITGSHAPRGSLKIQIKKGPIRRSGL